MGKPDAPEAPDYKGAAEATAKSDQEMLQQQTLANRPTQITPFGKTTWEQDPSGGWTQTTSLSDVSQGALDSQQAVQKGRSDMALGLMDRSKNEFGDQMDWSKFGDMEKIAGDPNAVRSQAENSLYSKATSRLDPRFAQKRESQESALRNQGLRPGDEAYDTQMANLGREEQDAYGAASNDASIYGGQEAQLNQNMGAQSAGFNNTVRQGRVAEEMQKRGFSLNEINAILTGQQVGLPSAPGFNTAGKAAGTNYTGAAQDQYGADLDKSNFEQAQYQSVMDAGMKGAMMFSDIRLKEDIQYLFTKKGRRFYVWNWKSGGSGFGVIAQENMDIATQHPSGFLVVDYGRI